MKALALLILFPSVSFASYFQCEFLDKDGKVLKTAILEAETSDEAGERFAGRELIVFEDSFYVRETFSLAEALAGTLPRVADIDCK